LRLLALKKSFHCIFSYFARGGVPTGVLENACLITALPYPGRNVKQFIYNYFNKKVAQIIYICIITTSKQQTRRGNKMTKAEFNALAAAKSVIHAFYTAMRQGVSRTQAEMWAIQASNANKVIVAMIRKA